MSSPPAGRRPPETADHYTYLAAPSVSKDFHAAGPLGGGTTVTLTGTSFGHVSAVEFGGTAGTSITAASTTSLAVKAPAHTVGTIDVT